MGSRQNRETRPEYPTGHNKGNDSPPREVPVIEAGASPVVSTPPVAYGKPLGEPPEVNPEREAERLEKETQTGTREQYKAAVAADEAGSKAETQTQIAADNRRSAGRSPSTGTDLSALGAAKTILGRRNP